MKLTVCCPECKGDGYVLLNEELSSVMKAIGKREIRACDLWAEMPDEVGVTAYNNRLARLLRYGFVTRRKQGKFWLYRKAEVAR